MINDPRTERERIPAALKAPGTRSRQIGQVESFLFSALAPSLAVVFTNPFDTAKVRLQLQGESPAANPPRVAYSGTGPIPTSSAAPIYRNSWDALVKIWRVEGMRGLQRGLSPAILREASKNLFRIGMYDPLLSTLHPSPTSAPVWKRVLAGSLCGALGALSCSPFELVKTRLQSAANSTLAVGHQHQYRGVVHGLRSIWQQGGFPGLYKGSMLSVARSMVGSGANLSGYSLVKEYLILQRGWLDGTLVDMIAGLSSGLLSCTCMNPIDVVRTRYYNQTFVHGVGTRYPSGLSAFATIFQTEGPQAFYKGFLAHFLRIGPHFCLTFVFLGILRRSTTDYYSQLDLRDAFALLDTNSDGFLSRTDVSSILRKVVPEEQDESVVHAYESRIFAKADHDGDSAISVKEFPDMASELNAILQEEGRRRRTLCTSTNPTPSTGPASPT